MQVEGIVRNLGGGGLMASFPVTISVGALAELALKTRPGQVRVRATVVWANAIGSEVHHGFAFPGP